MIHIRTPLTSTRLSLFVLNILIFGSLIILMVSLSACSKSEGDSHSDSNLSSESSIFSDRNNPSSNKVTFQNQNQNQNKNKNQTQQHSANDAASIVDLTPKPFYFTLGGTPDQNLNLIGIAQEAQGVTMFCEDDFTHLPEWTMIFGRPIPLADTAFNNAYLTFDNERHLQRVVLAATMDTEEAQNIVYYRLKEYLQQRYPQVSTPPLLSLKMPTNEVLRDKGATAYMGYAYQGMLTYQSEAGYILLYKRNKGVVKPPAAIHPSDNGIYAEYVNLGEDVPQWAHASPTKEVLINHYSTSFARRYAQQCE